MKFTSFKLWLNVVTFLALGFLIYVSCAQIAEAFREFRDLNFFWLVLIIPLQCANYASVAMYYRSYLKNLGEDVRFSRLFKLALEMNFVNNIFPSGGVSGFGYFGVRMQSEGVSASKATLTQVMRHTLTFLSFIVYMALALFILSLFGNASRFMVLVSSSIITLILVGTIVIVYIISSATRVRKFTAFLPRVVNRIARVISRGRIPRINIERIEDLFQQLHEDYLKIHKDWRQLRRPFLFTMLMNLTELLTINVVYFSFGSTVNFGALIIAYAVANIAGLLSILPGGVGVYEGLMTAVLTSAGIARGLALSATVVYRVLNMGLFLPIGFIFYQMALRQGKTPNLRQ
jgi:uncharacterized protein (TIRG00374 family)